MIKQIIKNKDYKFEKDQRKQYDNVRMETKEGRNVVIIL